MDHAAGMKFEDHQKEERYKNLQRELKLASVAQMERLKTSEQKNKYLSPIWPSMSSINPDGLDTSSAMGTPSLQVSRVESEVVSSSTNLRKIFPIHRNNYVIKSPIATSSVKRFPVNNSDKDRAMMPPPPSNLMFLNRDRLSNVDSKQKTQDEESRRRDMDVESHNSSMKISACNSSVTYQESSGAIQSESNDSKGYRVFTRWRVLLNDQGQLIIKGTLECGKIARSKPVIQRLTNNKVQSVYKHIYVLDGNIVDERNELPDYIRGKFYNGFPDDWENVYQLWRNYMADGCPVTFRWPTPITDSDDDINSEITDFSYVKNKQCQEKAYLLKSTLNNGSSSGYNSKVQSNGNQNLDKSRDEQMKKVVPAAQAMNETINDSRSSLEVKDTRANNECEMENSKDSHSTSGHSTSNLKNASYLYEIIKEDKLRIILSNLGDKNCPPQYLDKFIELIDCLRYVLSYTSNNYYEKENKQNTSLSSNKNQNCQKCNNTVSLSESQDINVEQPITNIENKVENPNSIVVKQPEKDISQQKEDCIQSKPLEPNKVTDESSDSDNYMGIPHVSLNHLIKPKPPRLQKYKHRKNRSQKRINVSKEKLNEEQVKLIQKQQNQHQFDSSVSMTEDELDRKEEKKHFNKQLPNENKFVDNRNSDLRSLKIPSKMTSKSSNADKQKPVIKSCEPVNFDLKFRHVSQNNNLVSSDVSILNDEVSVKKQKLSNHRRHNDENRRSEEKLTEDLLNHPFLTYNSDNFPDIEESDTPLQSQENTINSKAEKRSFEMTKEGSEQKFTFSHKRKRSANDKIVNTDPFGSKENPKVLASWAPWVVYNDDQKTCSLKFEGKLLNEAGHILHRKFITDAVYRRHSPKLVETVNNEYFLLDGELNDTKHVMPKELLKQWRAGCPLKIKEFCEDWIKLKEGEGISTVENNAVYRSACKKQSVLASKFESPKKLMTSSEQQLRTSDRREENFKTIKSSTKPVKMNDGSSNFEAAQKQTKKRLALQLKYSSSSSTDDDGASRNRKNITRSKQSSNENVPLNSQPMQMDFQTNAEILTESSYNVKLRRKRQKMDTKENYQVNLESCNVRSRVPSKTPASRMTWTLEKEHYHNILSEDEVSVIVK